ncbi:DinB family protein [Brevibacillus migulae]|uniref:DinB family protein n=1 Tax=Brevibacillus migulae TaxID=1644114 RepID=UPI00106E9EFA|nr:DinB family protein [Brevibacillus migulae]
MAQASIQTAKTVRQLAIGSLQAIPEELFDIQPNGFNNTIRWNIGHIAAMQDVFLANGLEIPSDLPSNYNKMFFMGTKPADWADTPPSKEELLQTLSTQFNRLSEVSPDKLNESFHSPREMGPFTFSCRDEVFQFALIHEAVHLGVISSMVKAIQAGK